MISVSSNAFFLLGCCSTLPTSQRKTWGRVEGTGWRCPFSTWCTLWSSRSSSSTSSWLWSSSPSRSRATRWSRSAVWRRTRCGFDGAQMHSQRYSCISKSSSSAPLVCFSIRGRALTLPSAPSRWPATCPRTGRPSSTGCGTLWRRPLSSTRCSSWSLWTLWSSWWR